jgi:hypothetical protein
MGGSPTIPQHYYIDNFDFHGSVAAHLDGKINSDIKADATLNSNSVATLIGDPDKPIATLLIGDPKKPVSTDSKIELLNLPRFTLQDIKDMMKVRVHIPNYQQVCFKIFGQEFFSICMNGESQIITEPYIATASERCEPDCCEPDTRPFPVRPDHQ